MARFGTAYGVAFQHADDFADAEHAEHAAAARDRLQALIAAACAAVAPLGARSDRLVALARALARPPA
jgi:geranylgeranyl pyrophosphate synthase